MTLAILLFADATVVRSTEDVGTLPSLCVWFVFGREVDLVLNTGVPLAVIVYAVPPCL